jgi:Prenyltransferase and squalene oxidase repeat
MKTSARWYGQGLALLLALWLFWSGSLTQGQAAGQVQYGPGASPQEIAAVCRAIDWLHTQQLPDGGFGQRTSAPSAGKLSGDGYRSSAGATTDVVYVLALLGENPAGPRWTVNGRSALDALVNLAPGYVNKDAGQAGKVASAVALAGRNPRAFAGVNLIKIIQDSYDPKTGRYHPLYEFRHTLAVEGLLRSGVQVPPAALDALFKAQLPDGGWFWSFDGEKSDVDTTGRVLQVLAGMARQQNATAYARAADFLARTQLAEGGWNVGYQAGAANANSTAMAVGGLWAAGLDPQGSRFQRGAAESRAFGGGAFPAKKGRGALDSLLGFQEWSGAFAYIRQPGLEEVRLLATTDALGALAPRVAGQLQCRKSGVSLFFWQ